MIEKMIYKALYKTIKGALDWVFDIKDENLDFINHVDGAVAMADMMLEMLTTGEDGEECKSEE